MDLRQSKVTSHEFMLFFSQLDPEDILKYFELAAKLSGLAFGEGGPFLGRSELLSGTICVPSKEQELA